MDLKKTKKMLEKYIDKDIELDRGSVTTDTDIKEVGKELKKYERMYKFYMISTILLFVTLLVVIIF